MHYILKIYPSNFFNQPMMTEWEKKAATDKIYANAVVFFNDKITSIETYQENNCNLARNNWFGSANTAIKTDDSLK